MKKFLILFLFTPIIAFSQENTHYFLGKDTSSLVTNTVMTNIGKTICHQYQEEDTVIIKIRNQYEIPTQQQVLKFLELGISPVSYKGDLSQGYEKWTSAYSIGLKRNNKKRMNGHFNLMIGSVVGQNINYSFPSSATPNIFFKSSFVCLNYDLQYNIIKRDHFILFISQGIGIMRFTPKDEDNNNLADKFTTRAKNETFSNISVIFPHYIGFMYLLKNNYGAGFQLGRITPSTDYLDNISQLSSYKKPDNIFAFRFSVYAPLSLKKEQTQSNLAP